MRTRDLGSDRRPSLGPCSPQGRVCGGATQPQIRRTLELERQTILAIVVNDGALFTSFADSQLRRTLGTLSLLHDLVAQLTVAEPSASSAESLSNMGWIRLVAGPPGSDGHRADTGKPETLRIELQRSRRLGRTVAELKAQLQGRQLGRRTSEQHVGVTDGMECTGPTKGAADFFSSDGLADVVHNDQSSLGGIAQTEQCLKKNGHGTRVVFILIMGRV